MMYKLNTIKDNTDNKIVQEKIIIQFLTNIRIY